VLAGSSYTYGQPWFGIVIIMTFCEWKGMMKYSKIGVEEVVKYSINTIAIKYKTHNLNLVGSLTK
jgi:hypothetical protein